MSYLYNIVHKYNIVSGSKASSSFELALVVVNGQLY